MMKRTLLLLVGGLLLAASRLAAQSPASPSGTTASALFDAYLATPWQQDLEAFRKARPGAAVQVFQSNGGWLGFEDYWSHRCTFSSGGVRARYDFFLPPSLKAESPLLGSVSLRWPAEGATAATGIDEVRLDLERRLTGKYGPPLAKFPKDRANSGLWKAAKAWDTPQGMTRLYLHEGAVFLLAERRELLQEVPRFEKTQARLVDEERPARRRIAFRKAKAALAGTPMEPFLQPVKEEALNWEGEEARQTQAALQVMKFLSMRPDLPEGVEPAALYLVDLLLPAFSGGGEGGGEADLRGPPLPVSLKALQPYGVKYYWSPLGGSFVSQRSTLHRLLEAYPDSVWGQRAFADLMPYGFKTDAPCAAGGDVFKAAIARAPAFLEKHGDSPFRCEVLFELGRAYETWWSLSLSKDDTYAEPAAYKAGAEEARRKASEIYQAVAKECPQSFEVEVLKYRLPRLLAGVDTGCRDYFCVYD